MSDRYSEIAANIAALQNQIREGLVTNCREVMNQIDRGLASGAIKPTREVLLCKSYWQAYQAKPASIHSVFLQEDADDLYEILDYSREIPGLKFNYERYNKRS